MRLSGDAQGGGVAFWAFLDRIRRGRAPGRRGRLIEPGTPRMNVAAESATALFAIGTRGSALALAQANEARRLLAEAHGWERAGRVVLLVGAIDAAVHSAADLRSLPPAEDHRAYSRCARASSAPADLGRRDCRGPCGRARLPGRTRRLLPHTDCGPRPFRGREAWAQRRGVARRQLRVLWRLSSPS
jgi:hypothetical protein